MLFISDDTEFKIKETKQVLYFYTTWMPYHKKMITMLDKMEEKYKNIEFLCIDLDYFKSFIKRFKVESVPTILILNNGKEIKRINGLVLTSAIRSAFADICKD